MSAKFSGMVTGPESSMRQFEDYAIRDFRYGQNKNKLSDWLQDGFMVIDKGWASLEKDMQDLSNTFPNLLFGLVIISDKNNEWKFYARNGKFIRCDYFMTYKEPDNLDALLPMPYSFMTIEQKIDELKAHRKGS